jgi:hypothetical protein
MNNVLETNIPQTINDIQDMILGLFDVINVHGELRKSLSKLIFISLIRYVVLMGIEKEFRWGCFLSRAKGSEWTFKQKKGPLP